VVLLERTGIAHAASGKSGGFLALDWCDGTPLAALARRSFALHSTFAAEIDGDWGYRRLDTYGGEVIDPAGSRARGAPPLPWLSGNVRVDRRLGTRQTTAQVHPAAFTTALVRAAEVHGAELRHVAASGVVRGRDGGIEGVVADGTTIPADAVVLAMGPWSTLAAEWLPLPPVYGLKGHSLVFDTGTKVPPEALFLEQAEEDGTLLTPEVFPRADGTTYVCAISSAGPVPADPAGVAPDPGALARLEALCRRLSPAHADAPILAGQACFRPVTQDGLPLIGVLPGIPGAYVATGHSVWGILNAPATGEALAELILDGSTRTVDLAPFRPDRLRAAVLRRHAG
jgi:glycine/D-amino acid oxidase-like deaminating enzyme